MVILLHVGDHGIVGNIGEVSKIDNIGKVSKIDKVGKVGKVNKGNMSEARIDDKEREGSVKCTIKCSIQYVCVE